MQQQQQLACPSVIVTLYFDSHPSLPAHFAPLQSAFPQVHSWHFPFSQAPPTLNPFFFSFFAFNSSIPSIQLLTSTSSSLSLMDARPAEPASQPLKYQTWFLKVSIHCEGCRRKVKKVLKSIDGVFTATIDPHQQKVTVTGSVGVETLLRKLVRAGKHAEIWPEDLDGKGKSSGKAKKKNKNEPREAQSLQKNKGTESAAAKCESESKKSSNSKSGDDSPEKSPAGNRVPPEGGQSEGGEGGSGKKKKRKDQGGGNGSNGLSSGSVSKGAPAHTGFQFQNPGQGVGPQMDQVNLSPTRQQSFSYPEIGYPPPMVYVAAYNRLYPMGRVGGPSSYYVPLSPYNMCAGLDQDGNYQFQSAPLVSFEVFSDENANGCSIM